MANVNKQLKPFMPTLNAIRTAPKPDGYHVAEALDSLSDAIGQTNAAIAALKTGVTNVTNTVNQVQAQAAQNTPDTNPPNDTSFAAITSGDNVQATMIVDTGASLSFAGLGIINTNQIYGINVSATAPTLGQTLVYNGTKYVPEDMPQTFTPVAGEFVTGYNASTGLFTAAIPAYPVTSVNGKTGAVVLQLAQTFTPVTAGSPPVPIEFLTGYDAATGLFTASSAGAGTTLIYGYGIAVASPDPITGVGSITVSGSGTKLVAATATTSISTAVATDVVITDGSGNVADSGILISALALVSELPKTFTPILAGSPPEYEYLTGYNASTGLFSSTPIPTGSGSVTEVSGLGLAVATPDPITGVGSIDVAGSGTTKTATTADTSIATAPVGDFIVADGSGNVTDSGISIPTSPPTIGQVLTATSPTTTEWETPGGGSSTNAVQVLVDFGAPPSTDMVLTEVSAPWIDADTIIVCNVAGVATAEHAVGEGIIEGIRSEVDTITPGVGFILRTVSPFLSFGRYYVNCIGVY